MSLRIPLVLRVVLCAAIVATWAALSAPASRVAHAAGECNADETIDAEEQAFLVLINQHRAANGRVPLGLSHTLSRAAAWKSKDLGVNAYFAHDDPDRSWSQRIRDCGYRYNTYLGENIAAGASSAQSAFDLWRNSSGHNANMLSANYTSIGIGRAYVAGSPYGWYWTTEFGGVDDGYAAITDPEPVQPLPVPGAMDVVPQASAREFSLSLVWRGGAATVIARANGAREIVRVEFRINGRVMKRDSRAPYEMHVPSHRRRDMTVEARAYDAAGNVTLDSLTVRRRR